MTTTAPTTALHSFSVTARFAPETRLPAITQTILAPTPARARAIAKRRSPGAIGATCNGLILADPPAPAGLRPL